MKCLHVFKKKPKQQQTQNKQTLLNSANELLVASSQNGKEQPGALQVGAAPCPCLFYEAA